MMAHAFLGAAAEDPCKHSEMQLMCGKPLDDEVHRAFLTQMTSVYADGVGDILGQPFPAHPFSPPLPGAQGACAFTWRDRPCTLDADAKLHTGSRLASLVEEVQDKLRNSDTVASLQPLMEQALALAAAKDQAYAGAWRRQGYMGNVSRVLSKVERLRELVWQDNDFAGGGSAEGEETVEDTLLDLINLAAMTLHNVRAQNRWGQR